MGLGLLASIMLAVASKIFYVWEDPKIEQVEEALLGANCGGCGYAGCSAAAEAVVAGKAGPDICVAGGFEIAQAVATVLGLTVEEKEPEISKPGCTYGFHEADLKYNYDGVFDCRAAMLLYGGSKECNIGCLGLSTCVRACPFGALSMGENNLPVVNKERCTGCGICAEICPKDIITLSSATNRIMSDYKETECTAPCQRHCPAEIDIPEYIRQISNGNYLEAVRVIKEKNPFPLICGWICPNPCEFVCRRNLLDEPVSINALKKFVSNYEKQTGERALPYLPPAEGKKVAVVGGGVEGLTASYYLRRLGHQPKVLEATEKMGGILRYVITEERLPRDVLDWEIDGILDTGVESETGRVMGKDFNLTSLFSEGFDMVLLTTGGWDSKQIIRGKTWGETTIPGTYLLLDFLYTSSKGKKKTIGKKTVILGGGKTSAKAANICLNNDATEVTVVYPFSKEEAERNGIATGESDKKIKMIFDAIPVELQGDGDKLKKLTLKIAGEKTKTLSLDSLIIGAGRLPEMLLVKTEEEGGKWKTVEIINVLKEESGSGIFSIGVTGRTNDLTGVVIAVRRGRKIARALQLYASEKEIAPEDRVIIDEKEIQDISEIMNPEPLQAHRGNVDSLMTLSEAEAIAQAERCLNCGLICYKKELNRDKLNAISA
jgi:NADPH-dependent glutamate synthase beta subunit-like oxidoreductase/Na+-translocating ferredoxin:NAD+ oxidoreductase RNF subunit RnfB